MYNEVLDHDQIVTITVVVTEMYPPLPTHYIELILLVSL